MKRFKNFDDYWEWKVDHIDHNPTLFYEDNADSQQSNKERSKFFARIAWRDCEHNSVKIVNPDDSDNFYGSIIDHLQRIADSLGKMERNEINYSHLEDRVIELERKLNSIQELLAI